MKKKILITYAPYGSGHKSMAQNIYNYFNDSSDYEIKLLDIAKYSNFLGRFTIKAFDLIIKKRFHKTFNFIYDVANNKVACLNQMKNMKRLFDNDKLRSEIVDFNPDIVISTHFAGSNITSYYNKLGLTNAYIMTVVTDFVTHSYWYKDHESQDAFIVANDIVKNVMIKKGVPSEKVYAFGLPFDRKKMDSVAPKEEVYLKYNIDATKKTYLFFGGGTAGSIKNFDYFKALLKKKYPINLIFVSGKNKELEEKCRRFVLQEHISNVTVLGFVNDVYSLLNITDVVITKPGGATLTECIDMRVPMILIPGNGGPEKYNAKYIAHKKYGVKVIGAWGMCRAVGKLLNNLNIISKWQENLAKNTKNESTRKILELTNKLLDKK